MENIHSIVKTAGNGVLQARNVRYEFDMTLRASEYIRCVTCRSSQLLQMTSPSGQRVHHRRITAQEATANLVLKHLERLYLPRIRATSFPKTVVFVANSSFESDAAYSSLRPAPLAIKNSIDSTGHSQHRSERVIYYTTILCAYPPTKLSTRLKLCLNLP